jgi:ArsR family metal-binding transcriptional regulator
MSDSREILIRGFRLELSTPECFPTTTLWRAKLHLQDDISEVLPYLNARLQGGDYDHAARVLLWDDEGRKCAFRPLEIAVAPVEDREEAEEIAGKIIRMVNEVWGRRHEIEPDFEGRRPPPNVLDIYRLLPGTNCKECGYPTCMAYAAGLREARAGLAQCPHLAQEAYAENRGKLSGILQENDGHVKG